MTAETMERLARSIAEASAAALGASAGPVTAELVTATRFASAEWSDREFPVVAAMLACSGATDGEIVVVLAPDAARTLVAAAGLAAPVELDAEALAAIGTALDGLFEGVPSALGDSLELALELAPASAKLLQDAAELPPAELDAWVLSYTLQGEQLSLQIVQTVPASLAAALTPPADPMTPDLRDASDDDAPPVAPADSTLVAVARAASLAADATADVLSALFSEELSAATPTVDAVTGDPLATFEYPLIMAELSYLAGLEGSNRFILLPADAAQLAAAMMGTPETTGDGLSAIELSAVSEAMNQVMSALASELSKALGVSVEAAPPACTVVDSADQARETMGASAYRASFRLASTIFGAEIVQLVSPELAVSLNDAFASFALGEDAPDPLDDPFGAFTDLPLAGVAGVAPEPPDAPAGARELLSGIRVRVSAELGRSRLPIARVANMPAGSIVVLDRAPSDPVDVLVNGTPFAQAKVVLVDGEYAVQIVSLSPLDLNA
jgi:flagellar motor switch protein FliN/FliY